MCICVVLPSPLDWASSCQHNVNKADSMCSADCGQEAHAPTWTSITFSEFMKPILNRFWQAFFKSKLMTSTLRIWCDYATRGPIKHLKMAKTNTKIADVSSFGHFNGPYRHLRDSMTSCSWRWGPKLQFRRCKIKIG